MLDDDMPDFDMRLACGCTFVARCPRHEVMVQELARRYQSGTSAMSSTAPENAAKSASSIPDVGPR